MEEISKFGMLFASTSPLSTNKHWVTSSTYNTGTNQWHQDCCAFQKNVIAFCATVKSVWSVWSVDKDFCDFCDFDIIQTWYDAFIKEELDKRGLPWNNGLNRCQNPSFCKYIELTLCFICKVTIPTLHKMIILRVLVRLYMIFMVWPVVEPIKMGCWAYGRVFWGGLWILSVGYLGNNKGLKTRGGSFGMVGP